MPYQISEDCKGKRSPKKRKKKKRARAHIDPDTCAGCQTCFLNCPQEAISVIKKGIILKTTYCQVDPKICIGCGTCTLNCITGAVELS